MKKMWMLFLLCLTLLCAACGDSSENTTPTPTPTPIATPSPSPTPTPANAAKETLDALETAWESLLNWNGTGNVDVSKGFGYDVTMDISVNQMLMSLLGMADISNLGIDMTMDVNNELLATDMTFHLNEDELLNIVMFSDYENLVYNLPKYSSQYAGEMISETESDSTVAIPDTEELLSMYKDIVSDFFSVFKPEEEFVDNATIERDGYKVTGRKFTVTAAVTDLNEILNKYASKIQGLYPDAEMEVTEIPEDELTLLYFNVYQGENGTFAWEIYPDTATDEPIGLISAENGFCFFTTTDGTPETLFYSEKSSSLEGTLYLPSEEGDIILNYTLSDNSIILSNVEDTISVSLGWTFSDAYISLDFSLLTEEIGLTYNMVSEGKKAHMDMTISSYGTSLATLSADYTIRDFNAGTMPETYLSDEEWGAQTDMDALLADMEALFEKYPALETLFGSEDDTTDDDYDDWYDDSEYDPSLTYENEFMNMTGYFVDEYGNVDFVPLESEVLALGAPSTGFYITDITEAQRLALIDYGASAFDDAYSEAVTLYQITGNVVYDSVCSYYYTEYYFSDNTYYGNVIDLYIEAVTGDFYSVDVYNASRDEAFRMANELLVILGETDTLDSNLDATALEEGVFVGNFLIYGYDYGDYYCISIY